MAGDERPIRVAELTSVAVAVPAADSLCDRSTLEAAARSIRPDPPSPRWPPKLLHLAGVN